MRITRMNVIVFPSFQDCLGQPVSGYAKHQFDTRCVRLSCFSWATSGSQRFHDVPEVEPALPAHLRIRRVQGRCWLRCARFGRTQGYRFTAVAWNEWVLWKKKRKITASVCCARPGRRNADRQRVRQSTDRWWVRIPKFADHIWEKT